MSEVKTKTGRPSKYKAEFADQAYKLALLGCTNTEIAEFFEIPEKTFLAWRKAHTDFRMSMKKGRRLANAEVVASMQKNACGYEHEETKVFCSDGIICTEEVVKRYAPNTTAGIFLLTNREPDKFKHKKEVTQTNKVEIVEGFQMINPHEADTETDKEAV